MKTKKALLIGTLVICIVCINIFTITVKTASYYDIDEYIDEYDEGYSDGHNEGYEEGYGDGYEEGYSEGSADGYNECYDKYYDECIELREKTETLETSLKEKSFDLTTLIIGIMLYVCYLVFLKRG